MAWLDFREPVSAWTHFVWMILSVPATVILWRLARGELLKRIGVLVFGLTCAMCFGGSFLYHAVPERIVEPFHAFDHVAIYLFIAGTVTPIGLIALRGRWRLWLLTAIWVMAFTGVGMRLLAEPSVPKATLFYLAMGWLGCLTYFELARNLTPAKVRGLWLGGLFYTAGAIINTLHWPVFAPGVFESHELFHLFVMAGAGCHFYFLAVAILPFSMPDPLASPLPAGPARMSVGNLAGGSDSCGVTPRTECVS
jgi:hemolysin III